MGLDAMILVFWMLSFKLAFSFSSFTFIKLFSSLLFAIRVVSSAYLHIYISPRLFSSRLVFLRMYTAYKLNKQGEQYTAWHTPFPIWNQSIVPCPVLTVASWPAYRFLRRQVRWSGVPISWRIFHSLLWSTVKGFGIDVFLELSCFFYDPTDVDNLISGPLPFLNPAWTSASSRFTYCWSLAWRILSIAVIVCEMSAIVW